MKGTELTVLLEESEFVAVQKPAGLLSIPDRYNKSLPSAYELCQSNHPELYIVHRLDKDTSGILLFAKTKATHQTLNMQFEAHQVHKIYWCIAEGSVTPDHGLLDLPIAHDPHSPGRMIVHPKGKPSKTKYQVLQNFRNYAHLELQPMSGRTHQLRVHMAAIGHPLVCDPLYGIRKTIGIQDIKRNAQNSFVENPSFLMQRTALHAKSLSFAIGQNAFAIEAPLPKDFSALLKQLEKWNSVR